MKIIVAQMRDLEQQVAKGEISYSRMVEIINETISPLSRVGEVTEQQIEQVFYDNCTKGFIEDDGPVVSYMTIEDFLAASNDLRSLLQPQPVNSEGKGDEKYSETIIVRVDLETKQSLQKLADELELSLSQYMRLLIQQKIDSVSSEEKNEEQVLKETTVYSYPSTSVEQGEAKELKEDREQKPLKKLADISDEDAIFIHDIVWEGKENLRTASQKIFSTKDWLGDTESRVIWGNEFRPFIVLKVFQYIQSRGYELPVYFSSISKEDK